MTQHEFLLPDLGEGIAEAEIVNWLVRPGQLVRAHEPLVEVQTDKATMELPAPVSGVLVAQGASVGGTVKLGEPVAIFEVADTMETDQTVKVGSARPLAAPTVRQLARDLEVDLSVVQGSGTGGRILAGDVERAVGLMTATPPAAVRDGSDTEPTRVPLRGLRRTIARRMTETLRTVPMVSNMFEADVTDLGRLVEELRPAAQAQDVRLTWTSLLALATLQTLRQFPQLNASLDEEREEIVLHRRVHLGIATASEDGLLVPVVRNADRLSLVDLAAEIGRVSAAARSGRASLEELTGSTFTVTNYGSVGGWFGTPVVNRPEVGIVGFGQVALRPAVVDGELAVRSLVAVSVTVDHRLIDGDVNAAFGTALQRLLERPHLMLLGLRNGDG